jgi:hypothetical protein
VTIKKSKPKTQSSLKKSPADAQIRFSFMYFDANDHEVCPAVFRDGYTRALMQRLRDLSSWTVREFTGRQDKSMRNHQHDWTRTARPAGFSHLNEQLRDYPGWQFCLTANERGRVHGIIIDDTFHVIWLDQNHRLYP